LSFLETHLLVVERSCLNQEDTLLIKRYTLIHLIITRYTKKFKRWFASNRLNVSLSWNSPSFFRRLTTTMDYWYFFFYAIVTALCLSFISIPRGACRFRLFCILGLSAPFGVASTPAPLFTLRGDGTKYFHLYLPFLGK